LIKGQVCKCNVYELDLFYAMCKQPHLDLGTVTNRVGIYVNKIESSLSIGNKTPLPNQMEKLIYWIGKRKELINKIGE
jgi:hypothetical protein